MPAMEIVRIADLLPQPIPVEVAPGKSLLLHPLDLGQIVRLFLKHQDTFLMLYVEGHKENPSFNMVLLTAPSLAADIIAYSTKSEGQEEDIAKLPATVQLIALAEIWRSSVPDPKKLRESLSAVTDELQKLSRNAAITAPNENLSGTSSNPG